MLRKILLTAALLAASTGALARGDHWFDGRSVSIDPRVSVSIGSVFYDGFNIQFETGGGRYYAPHYRAAPVVVVPPPHRVVHVHRHEVRHRGWHDDGRRAWKEHDRRDDRRGWDKRRGWDDDHDRGRGGRRGDDRSRSHR